MSTTQRIETVAVRGSPMEVFLFAPQGAGPHPGLVLCQHIPVGHTGLENDTVTLKIAERGGRVAQSTGFLRGRAEKPPGAVVMRLK